MRPANPVRPVAESADRRGEVVTTIAVGYRDRFGRFGAEHVEAALSARGGVGVRLWILLRLMMTLCGM